MTGSVRVDWFGDEYMARVAEAAEFGLDRAAAQMVSETKRTLSKTTGVVKGKTRTGRNVYSASMPGTPPGSRSGELRRNVNWNNAGPLSRRVGVNARVPYAGIHETGGVIQHPGGTAYLVLSGAFGSGAVFISNKKAGTSSLKRTRPHPIPMPARPYLRPTLARVSADGTLQRVFNAGFRSRMKAGGGA